MSTKQSNSKKVDLKKLTPQDISEMKRNAADTYLKRRYRSNRVGKPTRTTFTLQEKTMEALLEMEELFGLSPRELFRECSTIRGYDFKNIDESKRSQEKQKKTYVLDDYSLNRFKRVATEYNISRDYCVELLIDVAHSAFKKAHEQDVEVIRTYKTRVDKAFEIIDALDNDAAEYFGDGHFLTEAIDEVYDSITTISESMTSFIESGVWEDMS